VFKCLVAATRAFLFVYVCKQVFNANKQKSPPAIAGRPL
jgi:hypothetical protein